MAGFYLGLMLTVGLSVCLNVGTVERIYTRDNKPALKGSDIQLVCEISQFSKSDIFYIYKTDSRLPSSITGITSLTQCFPSLCLTTVIDRYRFSADSSHVYINITSVNRLEDQKWWTCVIATSSASSRKDMLLNIITVPTSLQYQNLPSQDHDLAVNAVQIKCGTSCSYPQPTITWYYSESGTDSLQEWSSSGSMSDTTSGCSDSERKYSSTLSLLRYTIFPGNVEKTVKFKCSIQTFTGMSQPLYTTSYSTNVQFAVKVSAVNLKDGTTIVSGQLNVVSGVSKTLTCDTGVSRPAATIVWYIESEVEQRSTSNTFTFTPDNSYHNKKVYCKAFNIQPESEAVNSYKSTVYVQDKATIKSFAINVETKNTTYTVNEKDNIQFVCAVDSKPNSSIEIVFQDKVIHTQNGTTVLKYNHKVTSCLDAGTYTCSARNQYNFGKDAIAKLELRVKCSPRPLHQIKTNFTSSLNETVTLTFTTLAYPEPGINGFDWYKQNSFTWIRLLSNTDLFITSLGLETSLTIKRVYTSDFGHYRVTVTNDIGNYDQYLYLVEKKEQTTTVAISDFDNTGQQSNNTGLIVGVTFGVLFVAVTIYAIVITIYLKRKLILKESGIQPSASKKQTTYANISYRTEDPTHMYSRPSNDDTSAVVGHSRPTITDTTTIGQDQDDSLQQYTDLVHYANDDNKAYDVIHKT